MEASLRLLPCTAGASELSSPTPEGLSKSAPPAAALESLLLTAQLIQTRIQMERLPTAKPSGQRTSDPRPVVLVKD